jgi:hypothetical protein
MSPQDMAKRWLEEYNRLKDFFSTATLPKEIVLQPGCEVVVDVPKFVETSLAMIAANVGNRAFIPCINRLQQAERIIKQNQ